MAINDISLFSALRSRMHWHQERQRVLAENVSHADTPYYRPRDLVEPKFDAKGVDPRNNVAGVTLARTDPAHIGATGSLSAFGNGRRGGYETRPAGNAVNLEDQMIKVAANSMDYQAASSLYSRSLGLIKTAIGKR